MKDSLDVKAALDMMRDAKIEMMAEHNSKKLFFSPAVAVDFDEAAVKLVTVVAAITGITFRDVQRLGEVCSETVPADQQGLSRLAWIRHFVSTTEKCLNILKRAEAKYAEMQK